jgi:hypothetical protein
MPKKKKSSKSSTSEENTSYWGERPIVISKMMIDKMLSSTEAKPADLLALHSFYYYTSIWQKTWQARCTTQYAAKALQMSVHRIRAAKKELIRLGLVKEVKKPILNKNGHNTLKYYIQVHYFDTSNTSDASNLWAHDFWNDTII